MPVTPCYIENCVFVTPDVNSNICAVFLTHHLATAHPPQPNGSSGPSQHNPTPVKVDKKKLDIDLNQKRSKVSQNAQKFKRETKSHSSSPASLPQKIFKTESYEEYLEEKPSMKEVKTEENKVHIEKIIPVITLDESLKNDESNDTSNMMENHKVFLGNISKDTCERDVERFLKGYGKPKNIVLMRNYGFVRFNNGRDAEDVVKNLNGKTLRGVRVNVEHAKLAKDVYRYRLLVENLSRRTNWLDLKDFVHKETAFKTFTNAHHIRSGEGVVGFESRAAMKWALDKLNNKVLGGRRIRLSEENKVHSPSRGGGRSRSRSHRRSRSNSRQRQEYKNSNSRSRSIKRE